MLLLTDRMSEGLRLQQFLQRIEPCVIAGLHHPVPPDSRRSLIVCDVAFDSIQASDLVRGALRAAAPSAGIPILFLLRDPSHLAAAQARSAGATATLPVAAPMSEVAAAVRRLLRVSSEGSATPTRQGDVVTGVTLTGDFIRDMLQPDRASFTIKGGSLDRASAVLLDAIGEAGINAWLDIVWTYDDATYQHCLLVAGLATAFALELGLPPKSQNLISQAALLHDVGKAHIPRTILNKPGTLTSAETMLMRTHPTRGYAMLATERGLDRNILDVVLHHHEYLDGSGYPEALRGGQLTRIVRMVTICDIYAALIERRSYKPPATSGSALMHLDRMGPRLDIELVRAFRNVVRNK